MNNNKWTKANRLTEITRQRIVVERIGQTPGLSKEMLARFGDNFNQLEDGEAVWAVWTTTRTGLDREGISCVYYETEKEAEDAVRQMPEGSIYGNEVGFSMRIKEFHERLLTAYSARKMLSTRFLMRDEEAVHFTCYEALSKAGVKSEKTFETSQRVLNWLGAEHVRWMKAEFGENWSCVGELDYCINHYPDSSLATLAAKLFVAHFVTYDDFAAGYYTKEIEAIAGGTERAAIGSTELRKNAGKGGAKASRERKLANLELLMQEIEKLTGAYSLFSEDRIVEQAFETAREREPNFPKSKKTLDDYGTALRSEEPFKSRYEAVFRKNA